MRSTLKSLIVAAAVGRHEQIVVRLLEISSPRRRMLQTVLAAVLVLADEIAPHAFADARNGAQIGRAHV